MTDKNMNGGDDSNTRADNASPSSRELARRRDAGQALAMNY